MTLFRRKPSLILTALVVLATTLAVSGFAAENPSAAGKSSDVRTSNWQQPAPTGRLIVKYRSAEKPGQSPRGSKKFSRPVLRDNHKMGLSRRLSNVKELLIARNFEHGGIIKQPGLLEQQKTSKELRARARALSEQPEIEYASVEYRRYPLLEPLDPLYAGFQGPGDQSYLYAGDYSLHAPGAWDITTGSSNSVIAIVDTGILPTHPEIRSRSVVGLGYDFVSADNPNDFTSANDGDGRDPNPIDPGDGCNGDSSSWHGTAVASAAAANSNNSEGIAGIDWNARLLHARALGICGGTDADIIDAIRWSAGLPVVGLPDNPNPANVVNLSLGGATECTKAWQDVIDELAELNIVFVMAAGNEARNALRTSPANCANVITVGSSTPGGSVDEGFSNYGIKVTTATGGRNILVASNRGFDDADPEGDFYRTETGTSFSAALVSGAISLMHSLNPDLGPADVRAILQQSSTPYADNTTCDVIYCGGGILNLSRALNSVRDGTYNPDLDASKDLISNPNQAPLIALGQKTSASLFGFKDIRYFSIVVPERGLLQAETEGSEDLYGYLLNSDLSVIAMDDDSGDSTNFRVASLVDTGTYYLAVERESHRRTDGELAFSVTTSLSDDAPTPFTFTPVSDAVANDIISSNIVRISGLQGETILTVSDGFYVLNDGDFANTPTTIKNGDRLLIVTQSPGSPQGTSTTRVTVGAFTTSFVVTTGSGDLISSQATDLTSVSGCTVSGRAAFDPVFVMLLLFSFLGTIRRYS